MCSAIKAMQNHKLSSVECHEIAMLTVKNLQRMHSQSNFDMYWERVELRRREFDVEEAILP